MNKISVCIASYNGEKYIHEQLSSILKQLKLTDEVILSDDSSSDNTIAIVESFRDGRIKILKEQKFRNPITNFENALNHASGDIIFLSDQDDIWADNKVREMMYVLDKADMAVCDCSFIDDDANVILESYFDLVKSSSGILRNLRKNTYFGCCMAFKKKVLRKALPFPKDIPMHDIWLGFIGDLFFKSIFINQKLTYYRKHNNNASIASEVVSNLSLLRKASFRYNIVKYLPRLIFR